MSVTNLENGFSTEAVTFELAASTDDGSGSITLDDSGGTSSDVCTSIDSSQCADFPGCDECADDGGVDVAAIVVPIVLVTLFVGAAVYFRNNPRSWDNVKSTFGGGQKRSAVPRTDFRAGGGATAGGPSAAAGNYQMRATGGQSPLPPPQQPAGALPQGWEAAQTEEGETYYFNVYTGVSTWDRPMSVNMRRGPGGGDPTTWT
mmetsp:Transcript_32557/g.64430  ORF Transcript_32557/g.64430 Transcript_32557/m.64430 type:complete len:203 (-) Transcript_32557:52-660(-)